MPSEPQEAAAERHWINVRDPSYFLGHGIPYSYVKNDPFSSWGNVGQGQFNRKLWVIGAMRLIDSMNVTLGCPLRSFLISPIV